MANPTKCWAWKYSAATIKRHSGSFSNCSMKRDRPKSGVALDELVESHGTTVIWDDFERTGEICHPRRL
jgi:hypothetical protein